MKHLTVAVVWWVPQAVCCAELLGRFCPWRLGPDRQHEGAVESHRLLPMPLNFQTSECDQSTISESPRMYSALSGPPPYPVVPRLPHPTLMQDADVRLYSKVRL